MGNPESPRFIPFADIRFPEEPPLAGPPSGLEDTVLYNQEFPALNSAARLFDRYSEATNSKGRGQVVKEAVREILKSPGNFGYLLEAWEVLANDGKQNGTLLSLRERVNQAIPQEIASPKFSPTPEYFESLLLEVVSGNQKAEELLRLPLRNTQTIAQTVDQFYSLAVAMMRLDKSEVYSYTLPIFLHQVDWLNWESPQAMNFNLARFSLDDEILEKVLAVISAINILAEHSPIPIAQARREVSKKQSADPSFQKKLTEQMARDLPKATRLVNFYKGEAKVSLFKSLSGEELEKSGLWPYSLLWKRNSLRELIAQKELPVFASQQCQFDQERLFCWFPGGFETLIVFPSNISYTERELYFKSVLNLALDRKIHGIIEPSPEFILPVQTLLDDHQEIKMFFHQHLELTEGTSYLWLIGEILKPHLSDEQVSRLEKLNQQFKKEILVDGIHFISSRGDIVLITDSLLKKEGYRAIRFDLDNCGTKVTLQIGEFNFFCSLDEENSLKWPSSEYSLTRAGKAWLEHLILCHFKELRCGERIEVVKVPGVKGKEEKRKEFFGRRAGFRHLPFGWSYTKKQYWVALDSKHNVDLKEHNRRRRQAGKIRVDTFVPEAEISLGRRGKPFISKAPQATRELHQIL